MDRAKLGRNLEHVVVGIAIVLLLKKVKQIGLKALYGKVVNALLHSVPGAAAAVDKEMDKEVTSSLKTMLIKTTESQEVPFFSTIPEKGVARDVVLKWMKGLTSLDNNISKGNLFAYVYAWDEKHAADDDSQEIPQGHFDFVEKVYGLFMHKNGLNPVAFQSLRRMETDVISMSASLLHGNSDVTGTLNTGGTESILMCMKGYRDRARALRNIQNPTVVLPITAHPAFEKAAHYFDMKTVYVPVGDDMRVDLQQMERAIDSNTILLVGSAPQYPHGIIDPITEIASLAMKYKLNCHVDACVGGFMLPFLEKLGYPIPAWDFRVPGVTSISADLHKYGYAAKGASVILWKNDDYRKYQFFSYSGWPGGLFVSPSMLGSRSGGPVAAAWASLVSLGMDGYLEKTKEVMETSLFFQREINKIPHLEVVGKPSMTIVSFTSKDINIYSLGDVMESKFDWKIERQQHPETLHLSLMPIHSKIREQFIDNLKSAVEEVKLHPELASKGTAGSYGMVAKIPSPEIVDQFLVKLMLKVFQQDTEA